MFFSRSCVFSYHFEITGTRNTFQGIWKCITLNILIQNVERSRMYSLYSAHVMSCHCFMFAEHYHFNIFGIEWDRSIIITVISDHLSHVKGMWLVYFSFTKLKRRPNGHVAAATAHYHVSRAAALVLEICLSYHHLLTQANMSKLSSFTYTSNYANSQLAWGTNETVVLFKSFNPAWTSKVIYIKLITNNMMGIVVYACIYPSQTTLPL